MAASKYWDEVRSLFERALDVPVSDRASWLADVCGDRPELRRELESLLAAHEEPGGALDTPFLGGAALASPASVMRAGTRIGPYTLERLVGRGGMGAVYAATRSDGAFWKQVAIKTIADGHHSAEILRRFTVERQTLATLSHPNIARLLDGGTTPDGLPFLVMEFVDGVPIDAYCERQALTLDARLRLFRRVCGAVQHAHQSLVVHRDLKPDNVLVGDDGEPKLLDFGIAKLLDPEEDAGATTAHRPMTPRYASPEQVRGGTIGTSTDIYSLGVVLYQLVTGRLPYVMDSTSPIEIGRAICETHPVRPSEAAAANPLAAIWRPKLKGDLDACLLMALRKEPERRYRSVEQFSDDIGRYLDGLPIVARPDTFAYRAGKFLRRNRLASAAVFLAAIALVAGMVTTAWQARAARREADRAQAETRRVQLMNTFLTNVLALPDPNWYSSGAGGRPNMSVVDLLRQAGGRIDKELAGHPDLAAELHHTIGNTFRSRELLEDARQHFASALALRRTAFGDVHPKVAESLYFLGATHNALGRLAQAEPMLRQALAIQRALPAPDGNFPYLLQDFANLRQRQGDLDEAQRLATEGLRYVQQQPDVSPMAVGFAMRPLADILVETGDLAGAQRLLEESLRTFRPTGDVSVIGLTLHGLGGIALRQGDLPRAERLFREAIALDAANGKTDTLEAADRYAGLATVLIAALRHDEAEALARRAVAIFQSAGTVSYKQGEAMTVLAHAQTAAGRVGQAEQTLKQVEALADRGSEPDLCTSARLRSAYGVWLRDRGRMAQARDKLRRALDEARAGCTAGDVFVRDLTRALEVIDRR